MEAVVVVVVVGTDFGKVRSFLTREEKVSMLKEYKRRPGKRSSGSN